MAPRDITPTTTPTPYYYYYYYYYYGATRVTDA